MSEGPILEARGLRKEFTTFKRAPGWRGLWKNLFNRDILQVVAVEHVDLVVQPGDFVGLIGPNGAGKTTLVKALTGIVPVSSGHAQLFGQDCFHLGDEHKRRLALVMGQRSQLWWDLPPMDSFRLLQAIYDIPDELFSARLEAHASLLGVEEQLGIQLRQLSLGQRMMMELIGAFLHGPELVFLDEPTIGLDLVARETVRRFLVDLNREQGVTIVLTSHDMEDIEETCERLVLLEAGRVLYDGDLVQLTQRVVGRRSVEVHLEPGEELDEAAFAKLLEEHAAELVKRTAGALTLVAPAERTRGLLRGLFDVAPVRDLSIERQPLEQLIRDVYAGRGDLR